MKMKTQKANGHLGHDDFDTTREKFEGWEWAEKVGGITLTRPKTDRAPATTLFFPWSSIEWIDYGNDQYVSPTIKKSGK